MVQIKVSKFTGRAIQRAINKVARKGGGEVILPPGVYKCKKWIKHSPNVIIRGKINDVSGLLIK
jgi:hypothetical protein